MFAEWSSSGGDALRYAHQTDPLYTREQNLYGTERKPRFLNKSLSPQLARISEILPLIMTETLLYEMILDRSKDPVVRISINDILGLRTMTPHINVDDSRYVFSLADVENGHLLGSRLELIYDANLLSMIYLYLSVQSPSADWAERALLIAAKDGIVTDRRILRLGSAPGPNKFGISGAVGSLRHIGETHVTAVTRPGGVYIANSREFEGPVMNNEVKITHDKGYQPDFSIDKSTIFRLGPAKDESFYPPDRDGMQQAIQIIRQLARNIDSYAVTDEALAALFGSSIYIADHNS